MAAATHILDWSSSDAYSIQIEDYPLTEVTPWNNPYARVIVYPSSANAIVEVDGGTLTLEDKNVLNTIYRESVSFDGISADARYRIDEYINFVGYFFDAKANHIEPSFSVKNGKLIASTECYGKGFLTYKTRGDVYSWIAAPDPILGYITPPGINIFAFHPDKPGIAAEYEIPDQDAEDANTEILLVVYKVTVVQGATKFERPENWPTDNSYANYPSAPESDKPIVGEAASEWEDGVLEVFALKKGLYRTRPGIEWYKPSKPDPFNGVVWKLKNNVPSAPTDTISQSMIDRCNNVIIPKLQEEFPGLT